MRSVFMIRKLDKQHEQKGTRQRANRSHRQKVQRSMSGNDMAGWLGE